MKETLIASWLASSVAYNGTANSLNEYFIIEQSLDVTDWDPHLITL